MTITGQIRATLCRLIWRICRATPCLFVAGSFIPGISHSVELMTITRVEPTEIESVCPALSKRDLKSADALPKLRSRLFDQTGADRRIRVVALGSSSTQGHGAASMADTYPYRLGLEMVKAHRGLTAEIVNAGKGGETLQGMKARIPTDVLPYEPDLVIWQIGSNAVLRGIRLSDAERDLKAGINLIKQRNIDIVLMGMQFAPVIVSHEGHLGMRRLIARVAQELQVPVFDRFGLMRTWQDVADDEWLGESLHPDGLHMTSTSYRCLASALANFLTAHAQRTAAR